MSETATAPLDAMKDAVGDKGKVETVNATKTYPRNPRMGEPEIVTTAMLIVVRFPINAADDVITAVTNQLNAIRKKNPDLPPIVICPPGVTFEAKFEPQEMQSWRKEINALRVKHENLEAEIKAVRTNAAATVRQASTLAAPPQAAIDEDTAAALSQVEPPHPFEK